MNKLRKLISVSVYNYARLKKLGLAGDSFNDVLTEMLNRLNDYEARNGLPQSESGLDALFTSVVTLEPNPIKSGELDIGKR